jgi:hypothetical protein
LIEELTTDQEMTALLSMLVKRLPLVLKDGISYAGSHTVEDNYLQYLRSSDPIRYFAETALRVDNGSNVYVLKTEVHEAYSQFCDYYKLSVESSYTFSRELKKQGFHDVQVRIGGKDRPKVWAWRNVKLIDWKKAKDEIQEVLDL